MGTQRVARAIGLRGALIVLLGALFLPVFLEVFSQQPYLHTASYWQRLVRWVAFLLGVIAVAIVSSTRQQLAALRAELDRGPHGPVVTAIVFVAILSCMNAAWAGHLFGLLVKELPAHHYQGDFVVVSSEIAGGKKYPRRTNLVLTDAGGGYFEVALPARLFADVHLAKGQRIRLVGLQGSLGVCVTYVDADPS